MTEAVRWRTGMVLGLVALLLAACDNLAALVPGELKGPAPEGAYAGLQRQVVRGDAERGRALIEDGSFGCHACHRIDGIRKARGVVGPSLEGIARRSLISGRWPNEPAVLIDFIANPTGWDPETGMPHLGLSPEQARDIAAYLLTDRDRDHGR